MRFRLILVRAEGKAMRRMLKGPLGVWSSCSVMTPDFHDREACAILCERPLVALLGSNALYPTSELLTRICDGKRDVIH
jgi:hypothetical protein